MSLFEDLDQNKLRIVRPSRFVFLCGGRIAADGSRPESLRDYLYRVRKIQRKLPGQIVLAEQAIQLYRDTHYSDLIAFEEDIARLSAVVLVIAESAGSLAELGAFSSNDTIFPSLRVMLQTDHASDESFVRYGPIRRVEHQHDGRGRLGIYPWHVNSENRPIAASIKPHFQPMQAFIKSQLDAVPNTSAYSAQGRAQPFYIIYWIIYLAIAISVGELEQLALQLLPFLDQKQIHNRLYCMQLAGWIARIPYGGRDYLCVCYDKDPLEYAFIANARDRDSARRKFIVERSLPNESTPKAVRSDALAARKGAAS